MPNGSPSELPRQTPAALHGAIQFDIESQITGRTYRIFVFKPDVSPPPNGYPVVIAADGNMTFPLMATVDATFALTGKAALVVGVGYATDDVLSLFTRRYRDLTPPTPLSAIEQRPGQPPIKIEDYGGAEEFYRFLVEELRPAIARAYPIDASDQTLFGHSIAGMFTLFTLLKHPESFRTFVASSPAIWWNERAVLNNVPDFAKRVRTREIAPRVLILVGGAEQDVPATLPANMIGPLMEKWAFVPLAIKKWIARIVIKRAMLRYRMVGNARDLAARLKRIAGRRGYIVCFHVFAGEDHLTALPAAVGHGLAFALRD